MKLLEVNGLSKRFGSTDAVEGLTFGMEQGRCLALLGPNGAGKTTTLKMLSGLLEPSSGKIVFPDASAGDLRASIGYLPQYPAFFNWMSGKEFLTFTAKLARIPAKEAAARADELLERVGLKTAAKRRVGGYSGGMKQRLGLAQAVIHRPKLLILDEPVSALDPQGRREVLDLLLDLKRQTTILFSTHVLHDAEEISDDVMIMDRGRVVVEGDLQRLIHHHEQSKVRIKARHFPEEWLKDLTNRPYVQQLERASDGIVMHVTGLAEARKALLRELADLDIEVESFETGRTTLEDLFMKAVGG